MSTLKDIARQLERQGYKIPASMVIAGNVDQACDHMIARGRPDIAEWIDSLLSGDLFGAPAPELSDVERSAGTAIIQAAPKASGRPTTVDDLPLFASCLQESLF